VESTNYYLDDGTLNMFVACSINAQQINSLEEINKIDLQIENAINQTVKSFGELYTEQNFANFINSSIDELQAANPNLKIKSEQYF
jgi:hypothetical protein